MCYGSSWEKSRLGQKKRLKKSVTIFVNKNVRGGVTTYLWERNVSVGGNPEPLFPTDPPPVQKGTDTTASEALPTLKKAQEAVRAS